MEALAAPRLLLEVADSVVEVTPGSGGEALLCLGKATSNDLVLDRDSVSREHAVIEYRNNDFYLVDKSTNGSWVQSEDNTVTHVHRDSHRLWGGGWITLGAPLRIADPIRFLQVLR